MSLLVHLVPVLLHAVQPNLARNTELEIRNSRVFELPLIAPKGVRVSELQELSSAIASYGKGDREDFSSFKTFLSKHPASTFAGSIWIDMGLSQNAYGYYSEAKNSFLHAWRELRDARDFKSQEYANRALAELALLSSKAGNIKELRGFVKASINRPIYGQASEEMATAKDLLARFRQRPSSLYKCADKALRAFAEVKRRPLAKTKNLRLPRKCAASLSDLKAAAANVGFPLEALKRSSDVLPPTPSIAHLKIGHFIVIKSAASDGVIFLDPGAGVDRRMSIRAFNQECSGYLLADKANLKKGWVAIHNEVRAVTGAGDQFGSFDPGATGEDNNTAHPCKPAAMAQYDMYLLNCGLKVFDTPVGYTPAVGPDLHCKVIYNQREATDVPAGVFNFSSKWRFSFQAYIQDAGPGDNAPVVYLPGGGSEWNPLGSYDVKTRAKLVRVSDSPPRYERQLRDGGKQIFSLSDGGSPYRSIFLTQILDPQGNAVNLTYDLNTGIRLTKITDASGRVTTLTYGFAPDPLRVTKITDPYGRFAAFAYGSSAPYHLASITDVVGIKSSFSYSATSDFIKSMTTPYGTTKFATSLEGTDFTAGNRWLEATDPLFNTERLEFRPPLANYTPTDPVPAEVTGVEDDVDNTTVFWNKMAYRLYARGSTKDPRKGRIYRWNVGPRGGADILEYTKEPFEYRDWTIYDQQVNGQTIDANAIANEPSHRIKVQEEGTEIVWKTTHNLLGFPTAETDPQGRIRQYSYVDNMIDLLEVDQIDSTGTPVPLLSLSNYSKHLPKAITDSSGKTWLLTYNSFGQVLTITDPLLNKTTRLYDSKGNLLQIQGPSSQTLKSYTYDSFDRVRTATDASGQVVTFTYDALNRPTGIGFQDGTSRTLTYNRLDLASDTDRQGRTVKVQYNPLRQPILVVDPAGRKTHVSWCECGDLEAVYDSNGNSVECDHDVQLRPIRLTRGDGSSEVYRYTLDGRLHTITDGLGQVKYLRYNRDGRLRNVTYLYAKNPTPGVTYNWDPVFPRLSSVKDGTGVTSLSYVPYDGTSAGQGLLLQKTGPAGDSLVYSYDELGRLKGVTNGPAGQTFSYDSLGRVTEHTNPLGNFVYSYQASSPLLSRRTGGPITTNYGYAASPATRRLTSIANSVTSGLLSQFNYTYNPAGTVASWDGAYSVAGTPAKLNLSYDSTDWLTGVAGKNAGGATIASFSYGYDGAGNRVNSSADNVADEISVNAANEITGELLTKTGDSAFKQTWSYVHDANGSLTSASLVDAKTPANSLTATLTWDGEHRLVSYTSGALRTEFTYNFQNLCTQITEKQSGVAVSTSKLQWSGINLVSITGSNGTKYFFPEGVKETNGALLYFSKDHLGSIREVTDATGALLARYQYDAYGQSKKLQGAYDSDIGFGGYLNHRVSGLCLAPFRAYSPRTGRWISRDPIGEQGGANLYAFNEQSPVSLRDPLGLIAFSISGGYSIGFPGFIGTSGAFGFSFDTRGGYMGFHTTGLGAATEGVSLSLSGSVLVSRKRCDYATAADFSGPFRNFGGSFEHVQAEVFYDPEHPYHQGGSIGFTTDTASAFIMETTTTSDFQGNIFDDAGNALRWIEDNISEIYRKGRF